MLVPLAVARAAYSERVGQREAKWLLTAGLSSISKVISVVKRIQLSANCIEHRTFGIPSRCKAFYPQLPLNSRLVAPPALLFCSYLCSSKKHYSKNIPGLYT